MSYSSFSNISNFKSTKKNISLLLGQSSHCTVPPYTALYVAQHTLHTMHCSVLLHTAHCTLHTHISYAVNHSHPTMLACIAFKGHLNLRNHVKILRGFSLPLCHRSRSRALPPIAIEPQINCPRKQNKSTLNYQNSWASATFWVFRLFPYITTFWVNMW